MIRNWAMWGLEILDRSYQDRNYEKAVEAFSKELFCCLHTELSLLRGIVSAFELLGNGVQGKSSERYEVRAISFSKIKIQSKLYRVNMTSILRPQMDKVEDKRLHSCILKKSIETSTHRVQVISYLVHN